MHGAGKVYDEMRARTDKGCHELSLPLPSGREEKVKRER
jgi:hypothetical protein